MAAHFDVLLKGQIVGQVAWSLSGQHNVENALGAIACARHVGIAPALACDALGDFAGVKRRMEMLGRVGRFSVYDDFAHHPTAIATTLDGLRKRVGEQQIIAVIEPRSNTMKQGVHKDALVAAVGAADRVFCLQDSSLDWSLADALATHKGSRVFTTVDAILAQVATLDTQKDQHIVIMSNGSFQNIHQRMLDLFAQKPS